MFEGEIRALAERLRGESSRRRELARSLRQVRSQISITEVDERGEPVIADKLIEKVESKPAHSSIAGVDGGLITNECHGIDLIMTRAVGVVFRYADGNIDGCDYLPAPFATPQVHVISDPISDSDFRLKASLERQLAELTTATQMVRTHSPELLLLDGSVAPHPSMTPPTDSAMRERYKKLISRFTELYAACERSGTQLAGVVEDSRGTRFSVLLADTILPNIDNKSMGADAGDVLRRSRDTPLLFHLMGPRERTFVFKYSQSPQNHPVLRELGHWAHRVHSFYLRTAALDRPVRIDFLTRPGSISDQANELAATLLSVSGHHDLYGIPTVLIEADGRAKLAQEDMDMVHTLITDVVGGPLEALRLRRQGRPF